MATFPQCYFSFTIVDFSLVCFLFFSVIEKINGLTFSCSLPWQGLKADTKKQKYDKIREKKVSTPIEVCFRKLMARFFFFLVTFTPFVSVYMTHFLY